LGKIPPFLIAIIFLCNFLLWPRSRGICGRHFKSSVLIISYESTAQSWTRLSNVGEIDTWEESIPNITWILCRDAWHLQIHDLWGDPIRFSPVVSVSKFWEPSSYSCCQQPY